MLHFHPTTHLSFDFFPYYLQIIHKPIPIGYRFITRILIHSILFARWILFGNFFPLSWNQCFDHEIHHLHALFIYLFSLSCVFVFASWVILILLVSYYWTYFYIYCYDTDDIHHNNPANQKKNKKQKSVKNLTHKNNPKQTCGQSSDGEQPSDLLWRLQDLLHGLVRVLPDLLADWWINPEELWRIPLRLLPSSGNQSGASDALRRRTRTPRCVVRTRQTRRPYVLSPLSLSLSSSSHSLYPKENQLIIK